MTHTLQLSVLDQSPVRDGGTAAQAFKETLELAVVTEALGYHRYWVAEHHSLANLAGTSPEILIGQIAARTSRIRVGSGGVMLSHYSALKVAENFRVLESLFPGRIDLGIGRAPGSDPLTAAALAYPGLPRDVRHFPQQVVDLVSYLADTLPPFHPFAGVRAGPGHCASMPEIWLLGSRIESAHLAARLGLPFSYAHFFGLGVEDGPAIAESYRKHFQPSDFLAQPRVNVAVHVMCAQTEEEALRLASSRNLGKLRSTLGRRGGVPTVEEALHYPYSKEERVYLEQIRGNYVDGDPQQVKEKIEALAGLYQTTDITIVTICYGFAERIRSYELVADICGLRDAKEGSTPLLPGECPT